MIDRIDCRQVDLELLFEPGGEDAEYSSTFAHVETCPACQQRMQTLAGTDEWWRECRASLGTGGEGRADFQSARSMDDGEVNGSGGLEVRPTDLLAPPSHPELLGRLGRYDVERVLGRGGMGMVFKAFDAELNRPVAVKVLAPHLAGSGPARQRFGREARAAAAVVHEHVISIHDVQAIGETPYLVMQYVPGDSLQAHIDRHGALEVRDVVRVGHQIAAGLAAAHAQGVIHRDIKPGNILLENGLGRIVITDFGLAQAADECSLTHTGTLAGTPHYMSPEQADARSLDQRTDLFSLGSVLYFMATGRVPFRGDRAMAVLRSICQDEPAPVRALNPDVPAPLERVIARLHAKSPADRFASADEVRDLLAEYVAHLQQPLTVPLPAGLSAPARRRGLRGCPLWLALAIGAAVGMVPACWQFLHGFSKPGAGGASSTNDAPPSLLTGLTTLSAIDEQIIEIEQTVVALEGTPAASVPPGLASAWDRELNDVAAAVTQLEAGEF